MVNDPVGDFIIQLKNAGMVGRKDVCIPYSKLKHSIADALVKAGYIESAAKHGKKVKKSLDIVLKYDLGGRHQIRGVKRVSKPGRRTYISVSQIFPVKFGKGSRIISTPVGILTDIEARKENVGGEELFIIW